MNGPIEKDDEYEILGANTNETVSQSKNSKNNQLSISPQVPINTDIKILDLNQNTYLFIGNQTKDNDHNVFACKQDGFKTENFEKRTTFVITPTNDGYYRIMDKDHQSFLFIGNSLDNDDRTTYACQQKYWKNENDFKIRAAFSILPESNNDFNNDNNNFDNNVDNKDVKWRIYDWKHNSYLFVGNSEEGGDHTVYSVPLDKFNSEPNEWNKRTLFRLN